MKLKPFLLVTIILTVCMVAMVPASVHAQTGDLPFDRILNAVLIIVIGFAALVGVSKLTAALVSLLKYTGLVQDGTSDKWAAGLNLLFFIGLVIFRVFQPDITLEILDGYAGQIAQIAVFVLGFFIQMSGSKPAYDEFKAAGIPLIGKALSNK